MVEPGDIQTIQGDSPAGVRLGRRIAVVGNSGSGKTTLAQALSVRLGVPYVCSDEQIWAPGWTQVPEPERLKNFRRALAGEAWTFDGNVLNRPGRLDDQHIFARIDTLVWLDLPRHQAHWQLFCRTVRRAWTGQALWHGNQETWQMSFFSRDSILLWGLRMHTRYQDGYQKLLRSPEARRLLIVRLTCRSQIPRFLERLPNPRPAPQTHV